jgi:putative endonuclease
MSKRVGDLGQIEAVNFLKKRGYRIVHQNIRLGHLEADILVIKERLLIIIEVKSSTRFLTTKQIIKRISKAQFARLQAIGSFYVHRISEVDELRIDLVGVHLKQKNSQVRHLVDVSLYI